MKTFWDTDRKTRKVITDFLKTGEVPQGILSAGTGEEEAELIEQFLRACAARLHS